MIHYNRYGKEGRPILLYIHGFLGSEEIYREHINLMKEDYDLIAVDLAGHGKSAFLEVEPTIDGYLEQVEEVLKVEEVTKAVWVGHSMGGYIVLRALEKKLPSVWKAVLAYSTVDADDEETKAKRDKQKEEIDKLGVFHFVNKMLPTFFSDHTDEEIVEKAIRIGTPVSELGLFTAIDAMKGRKNQQETIDTTETPVLVIEGVYDKIVKPIETPNKRVEKVRTYTGHLGMMEKPHPFTTHIIQFLHDGYN